MNHHFSPAYMGKCVLITIFWTNQPSKSRWWFQIFFIFTPIWGRFPVWLIFFKWVGSTTNKQIYVVLFLGGGRNHGVIDPWQTFWCDSKDVLFSAFFLALRGPTWKSESHPRWKPHIFSAFFFFGGGGVKEIPFITRITYTTTVDGNQKSGEKTTDFGCYSSPLNNGNKLPTSSGERRIVFHQQ